MTFFAATFFAGAAFFAAGFFLAVAIIFSFRFENESVSNYTLLQTRFPLRASSDTWRALRSGLFIGVRKNPALTLMNAVRRAVPKGTARQIELAAERCTLAQPDNRS